MIRKYSLSTRLTLGFLLVLLVTLGVGAVGMYKITFISGLTKRLYDHPFTVRSSLLYVRGDVHAMGTEIASLLFDQGREDVKAAAERFAVLDDDAKTKLALAGERYLGPKQDFKELKESYQQWRETASKIVSLLTEGKREEALRLYRNKLTTQRKTLVDDMDTMTAFAFKRAGLFMEEAAQERNDAVAVMVALLALALFAGVTVSMLVIRSITRPVKQLIDLSGDLALGLEVKEQPVLFNDELARLQEAFNAIITSNNQIVSQARTIAGGTYSQEVRLRSDEDALGIALQQMTAALAERERESRSENWLKSGQNQLGERMRDSLEVDALSAAVIAFLAEMLHSRIGCLYLFDESAGKLRLQGSYASGSDVPAALDLGEGMVGQAAVARRTVLVTDLPPDYLRINSATGETVPGHVLIAPFMFGDRLIGVLELASLVPYSELDQEFAARAMAILGPGFNIALARREMQRLLETTLKQADELRVQQEEMAAINEELTEQTEALRVSEEMLREQQEELRATNEELEEKTQDLELQKEKILQKNRELEDAQRELETQAHDLEVAGRYKSDFLANMSHELRTPLNSLLILARDLVENRGGNLTSQQVESAEVIHKSGIDLLNLINDILDLSKIEAGKMDLHEEPIALAEVADALKGRFIPQVRKKGIELRVLVDEDVPETIRTDRQRLEQVLNNLMSNAVKFTEQGMVEMVFSVAASASPAANREIVVTVRDTGIGIPQEKLTTIFETFRQAESGTSRKYGGTGLGLAIARNLATLLGGSIEVESAAGAGSIFTLRLPQHRDEQMVEPERPFPVPLPQTPVSARVLTGFEQPIEDDRAGLEAGDRSILVIEDDPAFAAILRESCRSMGFKAICTMTGEDGLALAGEYLPAGVILDLRLPGMNGWQVLEKLKSDTNLRHIPVHIISCEQPSHEAYTMGAVGFLSKPASREDLELGLRNLEKVIDKRIKELLLVEDDENLRCSIERLIAHDDIAVTSTASGEAALAALGEKPFDCMVLDLGLPDMSGFELLKRLRNDDRTAMLPVIVYTGRQLTREEERELRETSESIIVKGAKSEERLVDETSIFLHRVVSNLNKSQQQYIINLHDRDYYLHDKVVLLVDDDMRNLFALAKVLEGRGLRVVKAEAGDRALSILREQEEVDVILMDIMMPGLDGYQTMHAIRGMGVKTPIIALTAKAMKEDRDKCLAAGANDYLAKPVDVERLMSMMRVWLYG